MFKFKCLKSKDRLELDIKTIALVTIQANNSKKFGVGMLRPFFLVKNFNFDEFILF